MIVLDTHAWVWWVAETGDLSAAAERAVSEAEQIAISTVLCWEVAMLVAGGRLELSRAATRAGGLDRKTFPGGDPADRIISRDTGITEFDPARVLW